MDNNLILILLALINVQIFLEHRKNSKKSEIKKLNELEIKDLIIKESLFDVEINYRDKFNFNIKKKDFDIDEVLKKIEDLTLSEGNNKIVIHTIKNKYEICN